MPGVSRIRLGSLEPRVATEAFVQALSECAPVCPQFHLALQSGSDAVLRRMKRCYNTEQSSVRQRPVFARHGRWLPLPPM